MSRGDEATRRATVARWCAAAALLVLALLLLAVALPAEAQDAAREPAYRQFPLIGSRLAVWAVAQLHLNFAAFILGVPIFAVIIEIIGWRTGEERYDWLSHEFVKLTFAAFSTTALLGALLLFLFVGYYPRFWAYMTSIFFPTYWVYALLFFAETFTVYLWYYGWDWLSGPRKWIHVGLGVLSNVFGTAILLVANSWVTFMISPAGVDESGALKGSVWAAINNFTWMPINIHRLIANIVFGGTIAGASSYLREVKKDIVIGVADPKGAAMYDLFTRGEAKASEGGSITEGIGLGRVTSIIADMKVDKAYLIPDEEAVPIIFDLLEHEGLCMGGSTGINVAGAIRLARELGPGHTIVTILADFGTRYQSKLFNPDFLRDKGLPVAPWLTRRSEVRVPYV